MMPAWIYALAIVAVLWAVFVAVFHPFRRGAHAAPRALPVRVDAGSMVLAEERTAWLSAPPWQPGQEREDGPRGDALDHRGPGWPVNGATTLGPYGGQLGPRARDVLAAYDARCVERWGHAIAG